MSDEPQRLGERTDIVTALEQTFGDWFRAPQQTCTVCGKIFRDMTRDADGNYRIDGFCYECLEGREQRQRVSVDARTQIARQVPPEYEGKSLDVCTHAQGLKHGGCRRFHCPPGDATAAAAVAGWSWKRRGGGSLYLWGDTGTGKSHLAYGLVQRELEQGRKVVALEWTQFLGKLRATFGSKYQGRSEADIEAEIDSADLVVLDDVGSGKITEWAAEKLWVIVNGRYIAQRQVLITSNLPLVALGETDLSRVLGPGGRRTISRLQQICDLVQVRGEDAREQLQLGIGVG